ncbi:MAG TPA: 50S ribosomal protein L17 [Vicinamibacterales bacterium]|nr:50S ribosomal protein L17 [Vicinamibacterales bacterium]
MRHRVAHRKLGRVTEHRLALLRNQATALLRHERIETTVPRAKELRPFVERLITIAKRAVASGDRLRGVTARRIVARDVADRAVVAKLFDTLAPRFVERPGGYTRLLRLGYRRGDSAEMAQVELVGSEYDPAAGRTRSEAARKGQAKAPGRGKAAAGEAPARREGVGGRIKAAAGKLRGRRRGETPPSDEDE